jgi:TonB family protein
MNSSRLGVSGALCAVLACVPATLTHAQLAEPAERTQRLADEPLRRIVEAGKLKSRSKLAEPDAPLRVATSKPAARSGGNANSISKPATPKPRAAAAGASAPAAQAAAPGPAQQELAAPAALAAPVALPLLERVAGGEPVLPEEILRQLDAAADVELEFTVNTDGSVSDVSVRSSSNPTLDPIALELVKGWRFKPIAHNRLHTVQLVFHPPD